MKRPTKTQALLTASTLLLLALAAIVGPDPVTVVDAQDSAAPARPAVSGVSIPRGASGADGGVMPTATLASVAFRATQEPEAKFAGSWLRCADAKSGDPIRDVQVLGATDALSEEPPIAVGRTDGAGMVAVPEEHSVLVLRSSKHAPTCVRRSDTATREAPQVVALTRAVTQPGVVRAPGGVALPNVRVVALRSVAALPMDSRAIGLTGHRHVATTDDEGRFAFEGLREGEDYLFALNDLSWAQPAGSMTLQFTAARSSPELQVRAHPVYVYAVARRRADPATGAGVFPRFPPSVHDAFHPPWTNRLAILTRQLEAIAQEAGLEIVSHNLLCPMTPGPWPEAYEMSVTWPTHEEGRTLYAPPPGDRLSVPLVRMGAFRAEHFAVLPTARPQARSVPVRFAFRGLAAEPSPDIQVEVRALDGTLRGWRLPCAAPVTGLDTLDLLPGRYEARPTGRSTWGRSGLTFAPTKFRVEQEPVEVSLDFTLPIQLVTCRFENEAGLPVENCVVDIKPENRREWRNWWYQQGRQPLIGVPFSERSWEANSAWRSGPSRGDSALRADLDQHGLHELTFRIPSGPDAPEEPCAPSAIGWCGCPDRSHANCEPPLEVPHNPQVPPGPVGGARARPRRRGPLG